MLTKIILIVASGVLILSSCKKEEVDGEFCAICSTKETSTVTGFPPQVATSTFDHCTWTQDTYSAYLTSMNSTTTGINSGITVTIKMETTCTKK